MHRLMLWLIPIGTASAHEGHGLPGAHAHGTEIVVVLAVAAIAGLWLFWRRGR